MQQLLQKGFDVCGTLRNPLQINSQAKRSIQNIDVLNNDTRDKDSRDNDLRNDELRYCVVGDISATTDWTQALKKNMDVVIHTAACVHQMQGSQNYDRVNHLGTYQLAKQASEAGVKRFIFLSSIKAMGEQGHFDSLTICQPEDEYGQSKLDADQKLFEVSKQSGMEIVILRLPLIYGPGVKANFRKLIQLVKLSSFKRIPLPFKEVNNSRSMMGLRNLVDLITCCIDHPNAAGKIYLPSDGMPISTSELMQKIANADGKSISMFFLPRPLLVLGFRILGKKALADRLIGDLSVDSSPIQEDLLWQAPYTVDEELRYTLKSI